MEGVDESTEFLLKINSARGKSIYFGFVVLYKASVIKGRFVLTKRSTITSNQPLYRLHPSDTLICTCVSVDSVEMMATY